MADLNRKQPEHRQPIAADQASAVVDDWAEMAEEPLQSRFSPAELVDHLIHNPAPLTGRDLFAFSDLSRADAETVRESWALIPLERRRLVVQNLTALAEEGIEWHLGRILRIALHDSDATVRRYAIEGLWEETTADLLGPLVDAVRHDEDEEVRAAAACALGDYVLAGELDDLDAALAMRAEQVLLEVLRDGDEPLPVQCQALESIAYSGEVGVRQLIEDAYYSPHEALRVSALAAMGRSADVHWRSYARAELQSPSALMRAEAARACGELEAHNAVDDLLLLLVDEEPSVRLAVITALGRIGGAEARDALRTMSAEGEPAEAEAAEDALAEMIFSAGDGGIALYDDDDADDDWDIDRWDIDDDDELGEYEQ